MTSMARSRREITLTVVPTMGDLVRAHTALADGDLDWLHRLVADWQLLADLSFADLLLWVPVRGGAGFLVVAQMRPTTGPTCHLDDWVGVEVAAADHPALRIAWAEQRIYREGDPEWRDGTPVREEAIPVRYEGAAIALVTRETDLQAARTPSRLDLAYLECAADLVTMIAEGRFPFPGPLPEHLGAEPRVGDGLIRLDAAGIVLFASPNALSAYRRLGHAGDLSGEHLSTVTAALLGDGPLHGPISAVAEGRAARSGELDANGSVIALRAIPLLPGSRRIGAILLVHDVTELRRRDRQLLGKDATIREIHHRVKNNLQTVAALLRLQSRRLAVPEARAALEESVRRVSSIALVHETLAQTLNEWVAFDEVADRIIAMVGDVSIDAGSVEITRTGSFGVLPAPLATALAMILTELLQNAVEHAFAGSAGAVTVLAARRPDGLDVVVRDHGAGLPVDFVLEHSDRLGLQIVRTLVTGELGGTIALRPGQPAGTEAVLALPLREPGKGRPGGV
jgi:two-component system, sensor histidine kinase PdtaS